MLAAQAGLLNPLARVGQGIALRPPQRRVLEPHAPPSK
jgi:hypothetical protein